MCLPYLFPRLVAQRWVGLLHGKTALVMVSAIPKEMSNADSRRDLNDVVIERHLCLDVRRCVRRERRLIIISKCA